MQVEYDLVIVGGSYTARYGAGLASQQGARVALVERSSVQRQPFPLGAIEQINQDQINQGKVSQTSQLSQTSQAPPSSPKDLITLLSQYQAWTELLPEELSLRGLSSLGVDVIVGQGEFQRLESGSGRTQNPQKNPQKIGFRVGQRLLRSHHYLLAPELVPMLPEIPGLQSVNYLTVAALMAADLGRSNLENLEQLKQQLAAQSWLVMGNPYQGVEISQILQQWGKTVTLISPKVQLLPQEESIANYLIQGQLEAQGIRLITNSPVKLIRQIDGQQWVQAGDRAIEAEQILLCSQQVPSTQNLNLEAAGVQTTKKGMVTNQYLQTTNPRIYAYNQPFTAESAQQIRTLLKNILILPLFPVSSQPGKMIYTKPSLARIGMTEREARQKYGKRVITLREYVKDQPLAQIQEDLTGFCQLVVQPNGVILGATIVGDQATELISLVTLAMRSHLRVAYLAQLPEVNGSLLQRTAAQWLDRQSKFYHLWQELKNKFRGEEFF